MTTAERIKTARKEAGITQDELASKMFVTHHCISIWERGLRQPKYETLARIADALGINVNRLLQTPMTNADRIRAMSDEELAEWLADMFDCHYCSEHERIGDNPLLSAEQCDQKCEQHCLEWLKKPRESGE